MIDKGEIKQATHWLNQLIKKVSFSNESPRLLYLSALVLDISENDDKLSPNSSIKKSKHKNPSIEVYKKLLTLEKQPIDLNLFYLSGRKLIFRLKSLNRIQESIKYNLYVLNRLGYRNFNLLTDLGSSYLMLNRLKLAKECFEMVLFSDRKHDIYAMNPIAVCNYAFVLKVHDKNLTESIRMFEACLNKEPEMMDARFFYHLGDALQRLNRTSQAYYYYKIATERGYFLSPYQRSLFNQPGLRAFPWWLLDQVPSYKEYFQV